MRRITVVAAFAMIAAASVLPAQGAGARPGRGGAAGEMRGPGGPGGRGGPPMADRALLRGITLDEAQRTRLQEIRRANMEKIKDIRDGDRPNVDAAREARAKGDTATLRKLRATLETQREAHQAQQAAVIRGILTAEQRTVFDANVAKAKERAERVRDRRPPGR